MSRRLSRQEQIEYIKNKHLAAFRNVFQRETVEEYFDEYFEAYEREEGPNSLFKNVVSDLEYIEERA